MDRVPSSENHTIADLYVRRYAGLANNRVGASLHHLASTTSTSLRNINVRSYISLAMQETTRTLDAGGWALTFWNAPQHHR